MRHLGIFHGNRKRPIAPDAIDPIVRTEDMESPSDRLIETARRNFDAVLGAGSVAARDFTELGRHILERSSFVFCSPNALSTKTGYVVEGFCR